MTKRSVDLSGFSKVSEDLKSLPDEITKHAKGAACGPLVEPIPRFNRADCEQVIQGKNNSWIVLGRDRPSSKISGYGGKGHTQTGMIDLVVGRGGSSPKDNVWIDPDFKNDAARIYISQKTDVDKNFQLPNGSMGPSLAKSAVALKADAIRVIGREGIKFVVGTDPKNSQGGTVDTTFGIELLANVDPAFDKVAEVKTNPEQQKIELSFAKIEPIPKGVTLALALDQIVDQIDRLSGIVGAILKTQMELNAVAGTHIHVSPFFGFPTTPSAELGSQAINASMSHLQDGVFGLQKFKTNLISLKNTYLRPHGKYYINSRFNRVT